MNKKFLIISAFVALAIISWFLLSDNSWEIKQPTAGQQIIIFGDSLVEGLGATTGNDFPSLLSKSLNMPVINAGFGGDTTRTALSRLNEDVLSKNPRIVVVLLGGNDFLQRQSKTDTLNNLRQIIQQIQAKGAGVVLVGVRKVIYSSDYENLAKETGSVYVSNILDETYNDKSLMYDQIHPNDAGYKIFAEKIEPAIQQLLTP